MDRAYLTGDTGIGPMSPGPPVSAQSCGREQCRPPQEMDPSQRGKQILLMCSLQIDDCDPLRAVRRAVRCP